MKGADASTAHRAQALVDSQGLVFDRKDERDPYKKEFNWGRAELDHYGFKGDGPFGLLEAVARIKPTVLIGTTGTPGVFGEAVIREMASHVDRPIILPLSNPTSKTECSPYEAIRWTEGRAIIATGSPFAPVEYDGKTYQIGQANNVYIFPGIGLGAILSETHEVSDSMFLVAAAALASCVSDADLQVGRIYPEQSQLRRSARTIAAAVIREARRLNLGRQIPDASIDPLLDEFIWFPDYQLSPEPEDKFRDPRRELDD